MDEEDKAIIINVDGVPIGRTGKSQTIVSVQFSKCRNVYQVVNAVPSDIGKKYLTPTFLLQEVCKQIEELDLKLLFISADAPMRAFLRNQKGHNSKKGCDYCYAEARYQKKTIWGIATINKRPRTFQSLLRDYQEHDDLGTPLDKFGYKGKSALVDLLPGFDVVDQIPVDPMHVLYLGVARCLFELLFAVGQNRLPKSSPPRAKLDGLNADLRTLQVASELARRPRAMDFKNWKGSEWRNLVLFFFPPVIAHLPKENLRRQMWLEFTYLCRAYSLDKVSFSRLDKKKLRKLAQKWYRNYHKEFSSYNMRYNVHLMLHLERIRIHGPFPEISAFQFEGSFAASSRAQKAGTSCVGMQAMRQSYLRPREGHTCRKSLKLRSTTTPRTNDTLIYTEEACYVIAEEPRQGDHHLRVKKILATAYFADVRGSSDLDFAAIGVSKYLSTEATVTTIRRSDVKGKLIAISTQTDTVLVTATTSQLREAD